MDDPIICRITDEVSVTVEADILSHALEAAASIVKSDKARMWVAGIITRHDGRSRPWTVRLIGLRVDRDDVALGDPPSGSRS